jgi:hypothetical protein
MMKTTMTIERARGETYSRSTFAVYEHGIYPRSSVLAGQASRRWVEGGFATVEAARAKYPAAKPIAGTTHVPVDQLTAHLPDDGDY